MNRHLLGSRHDERLNIPSMKSHKASLECGRDNIPIEACIVANELYVRCQHRLTIPSLRDFGYIRQHTILPHIVGAL